MSANRPDLKKTLIKKEEELKKYLPLELSELEVAFLKDIFERSQAEKDPAKYLCNVGNKSLLKDADWEQIDQIQDKLYKLDLIRFDGDYCKLSEDGRKAIVLLNEIQHYRNLLEGKFKYEEITRELSKEELLEILGSTIKKDDENKLITFLAMLSAYTSESQFNVGFRAPSSTGKSYIPLELAEYFPKEDVIKYAYASPTSFYHETGIWDDNIRGYWVDLERKILIFIDQPHDQLLQRLRPLLSHDEKELIYKITDKKEKKGIRTKTVIIRGFPAVIFCTGSLKYDEQEATRNFILSPETNEEKIREAIFLKAMRKGNAPKFENYLKNFPEREMLKQRIKLIKEEKINQIIIRNPEKIAREFEKRYNKLKPRHTRDIERLISLIQSWALLNLWHRERDKNNNIYTDEKDVKVAFEIFDKIADSQELGIPPYIFKIYLEVFVPLFREKEEEGLERKEIAKKHFEVYGRPLPDWFLRQIILPSLETAGLIQQEADPNDKRKLLVYPPPSNSLYFQKYVKSKEKNIVSSTGGYLPIEPYQGVCSYCGEAKELKWKDAEGNHLCDECKEEERRS